MNYFSTRGGDTVSGIDAIYRGLSRAGGLFVPASLPDPLELRTLESLSSRQVMAMFFQRFLPQFSFDEWHSMLGEAFQLLAEDVDPFELPIARLNGYLPDYFLMNADDLPTGSLEDINAAIMAVLLPRVARLRNTSLKPLILTVHTEDFATASSQIASDIHKITFVPDRGPRKYELATLLRPGEMIYGYKETFDERYRELRGLAADPAFEDKLKALGYEPLFIGPGHLIGVLTAGAMAAAIIAEIARQTDEGGWIDFVVARGHLDMLAGLVYASNAQLPVGTVFVGEGEFSSLTELSHSRRYTQRRKTSRYGNDELAPVNLERLLFEIFGHDVVRLAQFIGDLDRSGEASLSDSEIDLLNHAIVFETCDFKRCQRILRSVYDQTDYLVDRGAAEAIACWMKRSNKHRSADTCFILSRSPLLDQYLCGRVLLTAKEAARERSEVIHLLSVESGAKIWTSLERSFEGDPANTIPVVAGPLEEAIMNQLDGTFPKMPQEQGGPN